MTWLTFVRCVGFRSFSFYQRVVIYPPTRVHDNTIVSESQLFQLPMKLFKLFNSLFASFLHLFFSALRKPKISFVLRRRWWLHMGNKRFIVGAVANESEVHFCLVFAHVHTGMCMPCTDDMPLLPPVISDRSLSFLLAPNLKQLWYFGFLLHFHLKKWALVWNANPPSHLAN